MSRMTKFLKQHCSLEKFQSVDGAPKLDSFGNVIYEPPIRVRCRHEQSCKTLQTANGSIVRATSVYYVDESHEILPEYRIDGHVVISAVSYVNGLGKVEGYEVYV